jgi:hypothetical protein
VPWVWRALNASHAQELMAVKKAHAATLAMPATRHWCRFHAFNMVVPIV